MDRFERATDFIIIAGPTASGKSAMALRLAEQIDGHIINADSMQVYKDLQILTARPSAEDENTISHHLYGEIDGAMRFSVGMWLEQARRYADVVRQAGKWPIFVGGTGFYLKAAEKGISPIPDIPDNVRNEASTELAQIGGAEMLAYLSSVDPVIARRLEAGDSQRIIRAAEVYRHTGTPLSVWQQQPLSGALPGRALKIAHIPERATLYEAIERRFDQMVEKAALDEVEALMARALDSALPVMKAIGVRELAGYLEGQHSLERALYLAKRDSRRYAKRQMTWLRNNFISNIFNEKQLSEKIKTEIFSKILEMI